MTESADGVATDGLEVDVFHLTPVDVARRWRMSPRTLQRWRAREKGPPWLRLHGRIRYRHGDVLAYEQEHLIVPSVNHPGAGGAP